MQHRETIELLPWLLNRSLSEGEERRLRDELRRYEELREELAATLDAARLLGQPPPVEVVIDYALGHEVEERELIEQYLEISPEFAEEVELVRRSFGEIEAHGARDESWAARGVLRFPEPTSPPPSVPTFWRVGAVAAALVAVLGVGGWIDNSRERARLATRLSELESRLATEAVAAVPQTNVAVVDLLSSQFIERGGREGEEAHRVALSEIGGALHLILVSASDAAFESYEAEIVGPGGETIWNARGLERSPEHEYTLLLPRAFLEAGEYEIRIWGLEGEAREPVEKYALEIVP